MGELPVLLVPMVNIKMKTIKLGANLVPWVNIKIKINKPGANPIVLLEMPSTMRELPVLVVLWVNIKI